MSFKILPKLRHHQTYNAHISYHQQFLADLNLAPFKRVIMTDVIKDNYTYRPRMCPYSGNIIDPLARSRKISFDQDHVEISGKGFQNQFFNLSIHYIYRVYSKSFQTLICFLTQKTFLIQKKFLTLKSFQNLTLKFLTL